MDVLSDSSSRGGAPLHARAHVPCFVFAQRVIAAAVARRLLPFGTVLDANAVAFAKHHKGQTDNPARSVVRVQRGYQGRDRAGCPKSPRRRGW
jgi:hypothetical protein